MASWGGPADGTSFLFLPKRAGETREVGHPWRTRRRQGGALVGASFPTGPAPGVSTSGAADGTPLGASGSLPPPPQRARGLAQSPARAPLSAQVSDGAGRDPARGRAVRPGLAGRRALTAGSCPSCAGCSAPAACARTAWLELRARGEARRPAETRAAPTAVT